jgi:adenylate kinase family enzyme
MDTFPFKRIVVVGSTGSGKSTLAKQLAETLGADFIELDALHWEPNWIEAPDTIFRERVERTTSSDAWVVAGNYHVVRDLIWPRAQAIIWLDYSLPQVFWRLLTRTIRRAITKEKLFAGNIENFWTHLKLWSDESLFHWLFKTYWRRKHDYPLLFALPEYEHLKVMHFKHSREAEHQLKKLLDPEPRNQLRETKQNDNDQQDPPFKGKT